MWRMSFIVGSPPLFNRTPLFLVGLVFALMIPWSSYMLCAQENNRPALQPQHPSNPPAVRLLQPIAVSGEPSRIAGVANGPRATPARGQTTPDYFRDSGGSPVLSNWATSRLKDQPTNKIFFDPAIRTVGFQDPIKQADQATEQEPTEKPGEPQDDQPASDAAQEKTAPPLEPDQDTPIDVLELQIADRKKIIDDNEALEASEKTAQLEMLTRATISLQKAKSFRSLIKEQKRRQTQSEADQIRLQKEIDIPTAPDAPDLKQTAQLLQSELETKQKEFQKATTRRESLVGQTTDRERRVAEIPGLRSAALQRQKELKQSLRELKEQPEGFARQLQTLDHKASEIATQKQLELLDLESRRTGEIGTLLSLERNSTNRTIERLQAEIAAWNAAHSERRKGELEQKQKDAQRAYEEAINTAPALKAIAEHNQELIRIQRKLTDKIHAIVKERTAIKSKMDKYSESVQSLKQKVETTRMTPSLGMLLIEKRNDLTQPTQSLSRIEEISDELQRIKLLALELKEKRAPLNSPTTFVDNLLEENTFPGMAISDVRSMATNLVTTQLAYDDDVGKDYADYRRKLVELEQIHTVFIEKIRSFRDYVAQTALWIQSTNPIAISDFGQSPAGFQSYFQLESWIALGQTLKNRFLNKPYRSAILSFVLLSLFLVKRRLKVMYV